ncbi:MAG: LapA family protein [Gammaproteobacteria bacterium]|nr:MAG: LapA family protein [Gammaproteobacteria bacterium]
MLFEGGEMLRIVRFMLFLIILAASLGLALINAGVVQIDYYFGHWDVPLSLTLVIAAAAGVLFGVGSCLGSIFRLKREVSRLRKAVKLLETEIMNLRSIPVKDSQ